MTDGTICAENEPFGGLSIIGLLNKNLEKIALSPHQNLTLMGLEDLTKGSLCLEFTWQFFSWCMNFYGDHQWSSGIYLEENSNRPEFFAFLATNRPVLVQNATRPPCTREHVLTGSSDTLWQIKHLSILFVTPHVPFECLFIFSSSSSGASMPAFVRSICQKNHYFHLRDRVRFYFRRLVYNLGKLLSRILTYSTYPYCVAHVGRISLLFTYFWGKGVAVYFVIIASMIWMTGLLGGRIFNLRYHPKWSQFEVTANRSTRNHPPVS